MLALAPLLLSLAPGTRTLSTRTNQRLQVEYTSHFLLVESMLMTISMHLYMHIYASKWLAAVKVTKSKDGTWFVALLVLSPLSALEL